MEGLNIDNILTEDDISSLFSDTEDKSEDKETQETSPENKEENKETTEEVDANNLFEEVPESVGSEEHQEGEDTASEKKQGSSPKTQTNFYSSIAKALKEDGIFADLDDESIEKIKEPEDLAEAVQNQIKAGIDEKTRRVSEALSYGVEEDTIREYENTIAFLNQITEDKLNAEDESGEVLRKKLIYQDLLNKGYSQKEALEELNEAFENGTDKRKAKRALESNKDFYVRNYDNLINSYREEEEKERQERKKQAEDLKKSILEDDKVFGELQVDKVTRKKIYDNISKPVYKDEKTGELFTAIQKYEMENKVEFLKNLSLVYTLTDGFKNLNGLIKGKVNKEVKKGLRELEHTLNNTSRTSDGNLKFVSGVSDDPESSLGHSWTIDV